MAGNPFELDFNPLIQGIGVGVARARNEQEYALRQQEQYRLAAHQALLEKEEAFKQGEKRAGHHADLMGKVEDNLAAHENPEAAMALYNSGARFLGLEPLKLKPVPGQAGMYQVKQGDREHIITPGADARLKHKAAAGVIGALSGHPLYAPQSQADPTYRPHADGQLGGLMERAVARPTLVARQDRMNAGNVGYAAAPGADLRSLMESSVGGRTDALSDVLAAKPGTLGAIAPTLQRTQLEDTDGLGDILAGKGGRVGVDESDAMGAYPGAFYRAMREGALTPQLAMALVGSDEGRLIAQSRAANSLTIAGMRAKKGRGGGLSKNDQKIVDAMREDELKFKKEVLDENTTVKKYKRWDAVAGKEVESEARIFKPGANPQTVTEALAGYQGRTRVRLGGLSKAARAQLGDYKGLDVPLIGVADPAAAGVDKARYDAAIAKGMTPEEATLWAASKGK